uniref:Uncharacterized protein n=1 Tax=Parascaris equorum TaxID=6256 RepID=A0A914RVX1_PAREQ
MQIEFNFQLPRTSGEVCATSLTLAVLSVKASKKSLL